MGLFRTEGKVYKAAAEVDLGPDSDETYIRAKVKVELWGMLAVSVAFLVFLGLFRGGLLTDGLVFFPVFRFLAPRVAGILVKIFVWILESRIIGPAVLYILKKDNLIHKLVSYAVFKERPLFTPAHAWEDPKEEEVTFVKPDLAPAERVQEAMNCLPTVSGAREASLASNFSHWTVMDYSRAYRSGETSPLLVAKKFLAAIQQSSDMNLKMSFFIRYNPEDILRQATESTQRYERGNPISVLDGVLIAVKDEIDCTPYPTTGGTKWLHKFRPCIEDAHCVKQLRLCGAILVGKTNMHELGVGTSGINPHYGVSRNPYDPNKVSGGSSGGSAAVVCAGLCPVTLGVDGGGSVRMPAALCGVVGLKPTFGRLSHSGVLPLNWTVGNLGILSGTVEDTLLVYAAISGHPPSDLPTSLQPELNFPQFASTKSISNIRLAKYDKWFNDSKEDVRSCCEKAVNLICGHYGWKIVGVTVPEIEEMRLAHYMTIGSECTTSLAPYLDKLDFGEIGWDARIALCVYSSFSSREYLNAQRLRNRQMYFHKEIFKVADVIVTPTTGVTAYPIQDDSLETGELDYINGAALMRFQVAGNFLGLPVITVPVGYDKEGMPIGLQLIGRPWSEATLLHLAFAIQDLCIKSYRKPKVFFDLLKKK
ncbi:hypothetical protein Taro_011832 [Colocasia esculenta]|uniref:Amidase domain-containing protein n=1 Tax=Colocasia esculenta TaxID=4460 RepID=A0A843U7G0_COLES|nr:hypothetical protein [Colocasia esculenta]